MRRAMSVCNMKAIFLVLLTAALGTPALADDARTDRAFLGDIDDSKAPPPTTKRVGRDASSLYDFGLYLAGKGLPETAIPFLESAGRQAPERADIQLQLGRAYEAAHRRSSAREAYDRYLSLAPLGPDRIDVEKRLAALRARKVAKR